MLHNIKNQKPVPLISFKQQFAFKYLLRASCGSYDQNREWEVGNGYNINEEGHKLKMGRNKTTVLDDPDKSIIKIYIFRYCQ